MNTYHISKVGYYSDFLVFPTITAALIFYDLWQHGITVIWFGWLALGFLLWTLLEYLIHRFIFHRVPTIKEQHMEHHENPEAYIGLASWKTVSLFALPIMLSIWWSFMPVMIGVLMGFIGYIICHDMVHHHRQFSYGRQRHDLHHHHNIRTNYGVTTQLWDWVLGTQLNTE